MKIKIIIGSLIAFVGIANAQWATSGTSIYKSPNNTGNVAIGVTTPLNQLHIQTSLQNGGIVIDQVGTGAAAGAAAISLKNIACAGFPLHIGLNRK